MKYNYLFLLDRNPIFEYLEHLPTLLFVRCRCGERSVGSMRKRFIEYSQGDAQSETKTTGSPRKEGEQI